MVNSNIPAVRVENLTVGYGDRTILRNLNFTVNRGEIFMIMGRSGCVQSTPIAPLVPVASERAAGSGPW